MVFEVLSKSNTKSDQAWRKRVYASIANCQHYVTVATKSAEIVRYDRSSDWSGHVTRGLGSRFSLPALEIEIPTSEIYRWTPIA